MTDHINLYQKRKKIHPRRISGKFQTIRKSTIWITLGLYFIGPWLMWNGRQAILFDIPERKFYIFGLTFWPQDFFLFSWLLIIAALSLFFFTNLAGRVWCGYACPQTVWTKIFIGIERITEGDRMKRIKLDKSPWTIDKLMRRSAKHLLWLAVALATAITFVSYFTPMHTLLNILWQLQVGPWETFWLLFFTIATYVNAGWMREQVCMYMCPYARFQSAMFDDNTIVISYDKARGETRGPRKRDIDPKTAGLGDCIDCSLCVQVCPTGIDIRKGLQMECIGCAACIDACDSVMDKMNYPRGLVRYTTENELINKKSRILRPRLIGYGLILLIMISTFSYTISVRTPLRLDVLRDRHHLYRETVDGNFENGYILKIINMSQQQQTYRIDVAGLDNLFFTGNPEVTVAAGQVLSHPMTIHVPPESITQRNTTLRFTITAVNNHKMTKTREDRFIGPIYKSGQ